MCRFLKSGITVRAMEAGATPADPQVLTTMGFWRLGGKPRPNRMRFAELYANAVERLGDRSAPVRVGALHTLEALGQEFPQHRAAIINVLCAYLRMPDEDDGPVRVNATRTLTVH